MSEIERAESCTWTEDYDEGSWATTCGKLWSFEDEPDGVNFCAHCGGRVALSHERRIMDRREDDEPISHPDRRSGADRRRT